MRNFQIVAWLNLTVLSSVRSEFIDNDYAKHCLKCTGEGRYPDCEVDEGSPHFTLAIYCRTMRNHYCTIRVVKKDTSDVTALACVMKESAVNLEELKLDRGEIEIVTILEPLPLLLQGTTATMESIKSLVDVKSYGNHARTTSTLKEVLAVPGVSHQAIVAKPDAAAAVEDEKVDGEAEDAAAGGPEDGAIQGEGSEVVEAAGVEGEEEQEAAAGADEAAVEETAVEEISEEDAAEDETGKEAATEDEAGEDESTKRVAEEGAAADNADAEAQEKSENEATGEKAGKNETGEDVAAEIGEEEKDEDEAVETEQNEVAESTDATVVDAEKENPTDAPEPAANTEATDYSADEAGGEAEGGVTKDPEESVTSTAAPGGNRTPVSAMKCFACSSYNDMNCTTRPEIQVMCVPLLDSTVNGCYTLIKDMNTTSRGCISDLAEVGIKYCKDNVKFCSICYTDGCNSRLATTSGNHADPLVNTSLEVLVLLAVVSAYFS